MKPAQFRVRDGTCSGFRRCLLEVTISTTIKIISVLSLVATCKAKDGDRQAHQPKFQPARASQFFNFLE